MIDVDSFFDTSLVMMREAKSTHATVKDEKIVITSLSGHVTTSIPLPRSHDGLRLLQLLRGR